MTFDVLAERERRERRVREEMERLAREILFQAPHADPNVARAIAAKVRARFLVTPPTRRPR